MLYVSSVKFPNSLTLSALVLFIFHRVLMPSFHTWSKQPYVLQVFLDWFYTVISEQIKCLSLTFRWQCDDHCILMQGYKDIYLPVTCKCTQEFVLVTFHLYYALTNRTLQLAMYKSYKVKLNNVAISFMQCKLPCMHTHTYAHIQTHTHTYDMAWCFAV